MLKSFFNPDSSYIGRMIQGFSGGPQQADGGPIDLVNPQAMPAGGPMAPAPQPGAGNGIMGALSRTARGFDWDDLSAFGQGMASGRDWADGLTRGLSFVDQNMDDRALQGDLDAAMSGFSPEQQAALALLPPDEAAKVMAKYRFDKAEAIKRGMRPIPMIDAEGNPAYGQLTESGQLLPAEMPEGYSITRDPIRLDAGTHFLLLDPMTRQPIGSVPKDLAGAAAATAQGKVSGTSQAEAVAQLPQLEADFNETTRLIDELVAHPGLDAAVGTIQGQPWMQSGRALFDSDVADFRSRLAQLEGSAFLSAFESLKGGGQITEVEGRKATQAKARLDAAKSEADFRRALNDYRRVLTNIYTAVKRRGGKVVQQPVGSNADQSGIIRDWNPETGRIE